MGAGGAIQKRAKGSVKHKNMFRSLIKKMRISAIRYHFIPSYIIAKIEKDVEKSIFFQLILFFFFF